MSTMLPQAHRPKANIQIVEKTLEGATRRHQVSKLHRHANKCECNVRQNSIWSPSHTAKSLRSNRRVRFNSKKKLKHTLGENQTLKSKTKCNHTSDFCESQWLNEIQLLLLLLEKCSTANEPIHKIIITRILQPMQRTPSDSVVTMGPVKSTKLWFVCFISGLEIPNEAGPQFASVAEYHISKISCSQDTTF